AFSLKTLYQYSGSCWLTMTVEECSRLTRRLNTWAKAKADTSVGQEVVDDQHSRLCQFLKEGFALIGSVGCGVELVG
ncbi:hypothetical protein ACL1HX_14430, partial [Corynebacterium striatum]